MSFWNRKAQQEVSNNQQMSQTHNMAHQDKNAYETARKQAEAAANAKKK